MPVETGDKKDLEPGLDDAAAEGADGDGARRRRRRGMRVPSDDVPRPKTTLRPPVAAPSDDDFDVDVDVDMDEPAAADSDEPETATEAEKAAEGEALVDAAVSGGAVPAPDEVAHVADAEEPEEIPVPEGGAPDDLEPLSAAPSEEPQAPEETPPVADAEPEAVPRFAAPDEPTGPTYVPPGEPPAAAPTVPSVDDERPEPQSWQEPAPEPQRTQGEVASAGDSDEPEEISSLELEEERSPVPPPPPKAMPPAPPPAPPAPAAAPPAPAPAPAPAAAAPVIESPRKRRGKAWFEEVFDEDYLRTLPFLTPQTTQREASFLVEALGTKPAQQLLDVGCGYGRHAMELAGRGHNVTALDLSLPLLLRGADEAQRRGLVINFVHGDMRDMTYDGQFDAAYCLFSTFGYFDDDTNKRVAAAIARALKPGGRLILDLLNRDYIITDLPTRIWWEGDGCVVLEEVDFNYFTSRVVSNRSIVFEDGRQVEQEISIRAYALHEVGKLLHGAGFRVLSVSGGLAARGRFFGKDSRQIMVVAERRGPTGDTGPRDVTEPATNGKSQNP